MGAAGNECSWFGVAAISVAEHSINTTNVDLIGLSQTGVEYILMTWAYYAQKTLIYRAWELLCISPEFTGVVFGGARSAIAIEFWVFLCRHHGIFLLQFFYATAGIIGVVRWL
jgi:hypothetical protein